MRRLSILLLVTMVALLVALAYLGGILPQGIERIDTGFATYAVLKDHYNGRSIDTTLRDADDVKALKNILGGYSYRSAERPACMFDPSVSVTLTNGRKSITFCPAFCGDPVIMENQSGEFLHVSGGRIRALHRVFRKYGISVPVK